MNQLFSATMSPKEIKDNLQAMAYNIEETSYYVPLTQDDLDVRREKLTDNVIKFSELDATLKATTKMLKDEQKPLKDENIELMQAIKSKSEKRDGILYHVDNQEDGMMNSYDELGVLISARRLRPDEKQSSIFQISKTN